MIVAEDTVRISLVFCGVWPFSPMVGDDRVYHLAKPAEHVIRILRSPHALPIPHGGAWYDVLSLITIGVEPDKTTGSHDSLRFRNDGPENLPSNYPTSECERLELSAPNVVPPFPCKDLNKCSVEDCKALSLTPK